MQPGFAEVAALLRRRAGIVLTEDKAYLLETRLGPVLTRFGLASLRALGERLRALPGEALERAVVEALTTHESSFFRDGRPFEHLRALLPRLAAGKPAGERLRIWSAACSTGQEAYSVAMLAAEAFGPAAAQRVEILGTDISGEVVARAREGAFTQFEVQRGLPIRSLMQHFVQDGPRWRVNAALRALTRFEERNLLADCAALGRFDVIFCRNVLIYFDAPTKTQVLDMLARQLAGEGVLYLGAAETVIGLTERLAPLPGERGVYGVAARRAAA
ncbi:CheR family methyltransferase [Falsiroseomonas oryzae]|uniref:CheR family methyltransferase n=1 Tax=Falsiroseomonas oryzae TaxID=2766473 RepID=UPI0022EA7F65|nr:protein-glutamate O-methyltransferase CheR [Roseomonas sp. MO-31]